MLRFVTKKERTLVFFFPGEAGLMKDAGEFLDYLDHT